MAFLNCNHVFCKICVKKSVIMAFKLMKEFKCLDKQCSEVISHNNVKEIVGKELYDKLQSIQLEKMKTMHNGNGEMVECCKCKKGFLFESGNSAYAPKEDDNGKPLNQ